MIGTNKLRRVVRRELDRLGAADVVFDNGGKHPYVTFRVGDRSYKFGFSGSSSTSGIEKDMRFKIKRHIKETDQWIHTTSRSRSASATDADAEKS